MQEVTKNFEKRKKSSQPTELKPSVISLPIAVPQSNAL